MRFAVLAIPFSLTLWGAPPGPRGTPSSRPVVFNDFLAPSTDHPAIGYFADSRRLLRDPVSALNRKIQQGTAQLRFEDRAGYLRSVLAALDVPVESQIAVFSKTSLQTERIEPKNPRTIFFNDSVAVAWVRGGFIELASVEPEQGVIFYMLAQRQAAKPEFIRRDECLRCHISEISLGVPGMMIRSRYTAPDGMQRLVLGGYTTDHRSPLEERWGGWYVTGSAGSAHHMGNAMIVDEEHPEAMVTPQTLRANSLEGKFDTGAYLSPYSDIAALMVFNHQMHMTNLLTRMGWEVRAAMHDKRDIAGLLRDGASELVDYLFFVDEAPLAGKIRGTSGFTEKFAAARGPADSKGRSLRQLDLEKRLLRYPCSYMIYSEQFDSLPEQARAAIYQRMWQILSGQEKDPKYARLSLADRRAIVEILRETKKALPEYFRAAF
jgi:hypothetical protein